MIIMNSNLIICQMELIKQTEDLINLIEVTQQELLEDVNKQQYPLLYDLCLENLAKRSEILKKKISFILDRIKEVK